MSLLPADDPLFDEDNSNTPTLPHIPTILPAAAHHPQLLPWSQPPSSASASSSSASSSASSSSDSLFSPSSSSSSSPSFCRHHPLEPDIPTCFSSSSSLCLAIPASAPLTRNIKPTLPTFLLPGPALSHPHLALSSQHSLNPPPNFAIVAPGLFRSSFPKPENFDFLAKLKLRTILTLVQEPYPAELVQHYERVGIKLIQFPIPGNKEPFVHIPEDKIRLALCRVLDTRNHPMLIHCNKGKHRTGCLVGCLRKLQHWSSTAIFDEYRRYAFPKSRNMDQQFIELFDHSPVWEEVEPEFAPEWLDLSM
ncbi:hypothetical protein PCANC_01956 [Puccinia coronata f. sp. avenae]|uniref:diphosphoinositol-polyphosphate diphosphatase n=1 Tax=Puccinia coronata f. sp. avenae TaxID=200324 RepID=A0A2N5W497_9BASI|nr:hypothetical protein PCANC_01956 [Puccinia coronata f. sp. avenae]